MKCQSCGENDAVIHFTKIVNGSMEESHLCESCAKKENDWGFNMPFSVNDLFSGLVDFNTEEKKTKESCPNCGMSYRKILSIGKFGCPKCYETFEGEISSLLRGIHGHDKHTGKIPYNSSKRIQKIREIEETRIKLDNAVLEENFEAAAEYRDKIKELEEKIEAIRKEEEKEKSEDVSDHIDEKLEVAEKEEKDIDLVEFEKIDEDEDQDEETDESQDDGPIDDEESKE